jgi:hypothetical protein
MMEDTHWFTVLIGAGIIALFLWLFIQWSRDGQRIEEPEYQVWELKQDLAYEQRTGFTYDACYAQGIATSSEWCDFANERVK